VVAAATRSEDGAIVSVIDRPLAPAEELEAEGAPSLAEEFLDELMPPEVDWRRWVRRYPIPSLVAAAATGYWLGRSRRGSVIAEAVVGAVALGVTSRLSAFDLDEPPV
jgi:hypothetical protein